MTFTKIKQLEDEVLELRRKLKTLDGFSQEKDRLLYTIALLVDRLGGTVTIDQADIPFIQAWNEGKIVLEVEQTTQPPYIFKFILKKQEILQ